MHTWVCVCGGGGRGGGWREKLNWGGGEREETISAIDMEDMGRNVNRVDAEKTFQLSFCF